MRQSIRQFACALRPLSARTSTSAARSAIRYNTTDAASASSSTYPFSKTAVALPSSVTRPTDPSGKPTVPIPRNLLHPRRGWSVVLQQKAHQLATLDTRGLAKTFFARRHWARVLPGSVVTVSTWTSPARTTLNYFSGVLMWVRHAGPETSIRVRNVINRIGVEMTFNICNPLLDDVKLVKRAMRGSRRRKGGDVIRLKGRAKINYIRHKPEHFADIANSLNKEQREAMRS